MRMMLTVRSAGTASPVHVAGAEADADSLQQQHIPAAAATDGAAATGSAATFAERASDKDGGGNSVQAYEVLPQVHRDLMRGGKLYMNHFPHECGNIEWATKLLDCLKYIGPAIDIAQVFISLLPGNYSPRDAGTLKAPIQHGTGAGTKSVRGVARDPYAILKQITSHTVGPDGLKLFRKVRRACASCFSRWVDLLCVVDGSVLGRRHSALSCDLALTGNVSISVQI